MDEKVADPSHLEKNDNETIRNDEVGLVDAPDGGRAAWAVVFGSFCVINDL